MSTEPELPQDKEKQLADFIAWGNEFFNYGFHSETWDACKHEFQHNGTDMAWWAWRAAFEAGRQQGMAQERALQRLSASTEEIEAGPQWQPIETAPKETEVLIGAWIDGRFVWGRSEQFYENGNAFEGETWSGWVWSIDDCSESVAERPTHWMPLPTPPKG